MYWFNGILKMAGLSLGVLNMSIVIPQVKIPLSYLDSLGKGIGAGAGGVKAKYVDKWKFTIWRIIKLDFGFIYLWQMFVSVVSGPLDAAFGGGNLPAFVLGSMAAAVSALLAILALPKPPKQICLSPGMGGGH